MATANRIEGIGGGSRGPGGYSYRSSELEPAERRMIKKQNKAAESLKAKDLDAVDKNKAKYQQQKQTRADQLEGSYQAGKVEGKVKAGLAAIPVIVAAEEAGRAVGKKQGTQKGHAVTSGKNTTKPVK